MTLALRRLLWIGLMAVVWLGSAAAQETEETSLDAVPTEVGKTAWYDPETGAIVPVPLLDPVPQSDHRHSRWLPGADKIKRNSTTTTGTNGWFNSGITTSNLIGWGFLLLFTLLVLAGVFYAFSRLEGRDRGAREADDGDGQVGRDEQLLERMKELPTELAQMRGDLRSEAERLMKLNAFDQAIKCLFGHQLLILDRSGHLRLSRGKTNNRYVVEAKRSSPEAAMLLRRTADIFEASYFGKHTPTREVFERLWQENIALEALAE